MSITQERKAELITEFGKNEKDSGSASVQVAILSERIRNLTEHLKNHKKDFGSRLFDENRFCNSCLAVR